MQHFMVCQTISHPSEPGDILAVNIIIIRKRKKERGQDLNSKHPAFSQREPSTTGLHTILAATELRRDRLPCKHVDARMGQTNIKSIMN